MEIFQLLLFIGVVFVVVAMGFFIWNVKEETFDYAEELELLPLEKDRKIYPEDGSEFRDNDRS